ncbi:hypothetical protein GOP47_0024857 [Adiantum capillus-veneris]|uniref:Survival of motor neuron-related-splicing factor 30 n=1 Tax=Adiantum capillus-veneris TaxID=13818 RepID=A0A9D4U316_ADICA|nr:hypothetical protein GOP47_0024857 [Adiantum capillus-veneris]
MDEEISIEELKANLVNYREQLRHVEGLLDADPHNAEYEEVRRGLLEVIELTEDLLPTDELDARHGLKKQGATTDRQDSDRFPVGTKVQAVWSGDGEWYNATVDAHTSLGYLVAYDGWGNKEEVDFDNVRDIDQSGEEGNALLDVEKAAEATRLALKRKIAESADAEIVPKNLPLKLQIKPDDPEDVKAAKRKKIHAFKSRMRLEKMEFAQNKRQNAWQQFQTSKGKSRKIGFFTGGKRESIFKSPEDVKGKVGVTGSGKGITEFQKREKHLNLKAGFEDGGD